MGVLWLQAYTAAKESPHIISVELGGVSGVATSDVADTAEFRMRASLASREAVAILCIEESSTLEMVIKLPASWPLRPAEVECRRRVGTLPNAFPIPHSFKACYYAHVMLSGTSVTHTVDNLLYRKICMQNASLPYRPGR